jgi:hypothetical protein
LQIFASHHTLWFIVVYPRWLNSAAAAAGSARDVLKTLLLRAEAVDAMKEQRE